MTQDIELDCRGMSCPVPVMKAGRALRSAAIGDIVRILADDPGVERDFPAFCKANRQELVANEREGDLFLTRIRKLR